MIRGVILALVLFSAGVTAQSDREKAATAKAQSIVLSGGPAALVDEFVAELSDIGRYEDRVIDGPFSLALKNFPQEAARAFQRVDFEIQLNLLLYSWERFQFPAMAPVLRSLYRSPPDDSARLRDIALRRLYQLDPSLARPFMLDELQRGDLRVSMRTLALLPDQTLPDLQDAWLRALETGILDERIDAAERLERFGSPAAVADVRRIYDAKGAAWGCDVKVAVLSFLAKHDPSGTAPLVRAATDCRELFEQNERLRPLLAGFEEEVVVTATRISGRVEDQPMRVEVLTREEVEEKMMMTPGDIVMMLNEMGGLRVQTTSSSSGAASVRIQGMHGRHTRLLFDGLPLAGQQAGGLGLLQIPPMDLGSVEVIKGVASALYGAGAMGGVINLVARRPEVDPVREVLLNQSTIGGTDAVGYFSGWVTHDASLSLLVGAHHQYAQDIDDDDWYDLAGYRRAVVRPRLFWSDNAGSSAMVTAGMTVESRDGGAVSDNSLRLRVAGPESIDTTRADAGGTFQTVLGGRFLVSARAAASFERRDHLLPLGRERDRRIDVFGETSVQSTVGRHTWIGGAAFERDSLNPLDVGRLEYFHRVPGVFVQDDVRWSDWLSVSGSARLDFHSTYGTFLSPRVSALLRRNDWISRISAGTGYFASTPLTEETDAAGLSRLQVPVPLEAETARSLSFDLSRAIGPATMMATVFRSAVRHSLQVDRDDNYAIRNGERSTNSGIELLTTVRHEPFAFTGSYVFVRSRERDRGVEFDSELTPRHSVALVGMWEREDVGRIGLEYYFTGRQRLEANPFRSRSEPYSIVGLLIERKIGKARVFLNAENLTNVRQTSFDPLLRPAPAADGRWTVDAWAPLDGRTFNGGVRLTF